jgi:parallel beta-helix repeat protein
MYFTRSQNLARDNLVKGNTLGTYLYNSGNSTLLENTIQGNRNGIKVDGKSGNNEFILNQITGNRGDGLTLTKSTVQNLLSENTIADNTGTGLVNLGNNNIKSNSIINNTQNERLY